MGGCVQANLRWLRLRLARGSVLGQDGSDEGARRAFPLGPGDMYGSQYVEFRGLRHR
jgi:hypothetical protein